MKIKQRGSSSLSTFYCIHGNRLGFDIYTIAIDRNPAVHTGKVSGASQPWWHPWSSWGTGDTLGTPCSLPRSQSLPVSRTAVVQPVCRKKS